MRILVLFRVAGDKNERTFLHLLRHRSNLNEVAVHRQIVATFPDSFSKTAARTTQFDERESRAAQARSAKRSNNRIDRESGLGNGIVQD